MSKLISSNNQESSLDALWNVSGVVYTAWNLNIVDTASASSSYIFRLQTNGFDEFAVRKDGLTTFGGIALSGIGGTNNVFSHLDFASGYEPKLNGAAVNAANGLAKLGAGGVLAANLGGTGGDGDKGDITVGSSGASWTIDNDAVTYAKIQNVSAASRILGRGSAGGSGDVEELTAGTGLLVSGTVLISTVAGISDGDKGDITVSATGATWTIDNSAVTYAKIQNVSATDRLLGRSTAGAGVIEEITCTAAGRAILDDADATAQRTTLGLGALATQGDGDKGDITVGSSGASWTIDNSAVTYAKIQNVTSTTLLGRGTSGAGAPQEITVGTGLQLNGTTIIASGVYVTNGDKGDISVTNFGGTWTIDPNAVTYSKIQQTSAAARILGRRSGALGGDVEELTAGTGLLVSGTVLISTNVGLTDGDKGDITVSSNGATWTVDNSAITYAKIQNVSATDKLLGRSTAGAGVVEEITCTAAGRAILDDADAAAQRTTLGLGAVATQGDGDKGDITVSATGATWTIDNSAVTYAKIQNVTSTTILGRGTSGTGAPQEITVGAGLQLNNTTLIASGVFVTNGDKGDITVSNFGGTWTIDNDAVTYAKIQNVSATDKVLGRSTAGAGDIEEITCTAAGRALLDDADAAAQRTTLSLGSTNDVTFASISTSGGDFDTSGDARSRRLVMRRLTTDATTSEVFIDGTSTRATLSNNSRWLATIRIVGTTNTAGANWGVFERRCMISRGTTAGSTALVGNVQFVGSDSGSNNGSPPSGWSVTVSADATNGALKIEVKGATATNVRWVAEVNLVEVMFA